MSVVTTFGSDNNNTNCSNVTDVITDGWAYDSSSSSSLLAF